ncbi:MAG TPA: hypothetical protein VJ785_17155 [Anaerolineales bacterium]|nr:hypothetical protein [Anaerolineales bacterium]
MKLSVCQKRGFWGGIRTTLSAVYVTPRWQVWADSTDRGDACIGASQLIHVDIWDYPTTSTSPITSDEGLNVTGRYTDKSKTGMAFIVLDSNTDTTLFDVSGYSLYTDISTRVKIDLQDTEFVFFGVLNSCFSVFCILIVSAKRPRENVVSLLTLSRGVVRPMKTIRVLPPLP